MSRSRWIEFAELQGRRQEWRQLAASSEFPTAFADPAWVLAWWECWGQRHEPWTFVTEDDDGRLRGLALLALAASRGARTLIFAGGSWNGLDTLVCAPGEEAELGSALIEALYERRGEWDTWRVERLRTSSLLAQSLLGGSDRLAAAAYDLRLQPFIDLPGDVDAFEERFGSKQRKRWRWMSRKLTELGAQARLVEDPQELDSTLALLLEMRRSRAIAQGQGHKHMDERYERFLLSAVRDLMPDGARLWQLDLDGGVLASRLNLIEGSREHSYMIAVGADHANLSPGTALELRAIAAAIEQGRTEIELGPGRDAYKYKLGANDRELTRLVAASPSARGRASTALAALDLRLRNTGAAEWLRRRKGIGGERVGAEAPTASK